MKIKAQRMSLRRSHRGAHPALRFAQSHEQIERKHCGGSAAQEHGTPAEAHAHGIVECCCEKKARVIAGLQVAGAHPAARLGPDLRNIGPRERPLAADPHTGKEAEHAELIDVLCACRRRGEHGVAKHRGSECARPTPAVADRAPEDRRAPPGEKYREQHGPHGHDVRRRAIHTRFGQQFAQCRRQHQREYERIHAVECPAAPGRPKSPYLRACQRLPHGDCRVVAHAPPLFLVARHCSNFVPLSLSANP